MFAALIIGLLFGYFGSMPLAGPISVLVFSRSVESRGREAFAIGVGASMAESLYACAAFLGFATFLADYELVLPLSRAAAAGILIYLGISFMRRKTTGVKQEAPAPRAGRGGPALLGFTITAFNPTLVATWTAATTLLYSTGLVAFEEALALPFAGGVLVGDILWYGTLVTLTRRHTRHLQPATVNRIMQVCGVFLVVVGLGFVYALKSG